MPESALPRLDPERRARLAALGIDLLTLRAELAAAPATASGTDAVAMADAEGVPRVGIVGIGWPSEDRLLRAVVAALGVSPSRCGAGPAPGGITLRVGGGGEPVPGSFEIPASGALRDPRAKRALWPALRALRRHLSAAGRG